MSNVKRCEKLAFMEVDGTYCRMTNFTQIATSKNPKEYSRQYVDEEFERSSIVGYSTSVGYSFDYERGNSVHELIKKITDEELLADDAEVEIVMVDVEDASGVNGGVSRIWSVIPDSEGDSLDAYTYSGSFKACGEIKAVSAVTTDNWQTITLE